MEPYLELLRDIRDNGARKADRTGTGTLSVFGRQIRFDLQDGFPLVTIDRAEFTLRICPFVPDSNTGILQ